MTGRLLHHLFLPGKKNLTDDACRARLLLKFPCIHYSLAPPPPPPSQDRGSSIFSPTVIILIAVLSSCFLLVSYYAIIMKLCSRWRRSRAAAVAEDGIVTDRDTADSDLESASAVNFIWYVHTVGLDESVITSIAVCKYKKGEGLVDATDCSVCLAEFREDEDLRLLPKCGHAFHVPCIDTWLASHVNCPLCRAAVVVPTTNPAPSEHQIAVDMESSLAPGVGLDSNSATDGRSSLESTDDGRKDQLDLEAAHVSTRVPSSREYYRTRVLSDLAGNIQRVQEIANGEDIVQYIERCVSMDSSVLTDSMGLQNEGECSKDRKLSGSKSGQGCSKLGRRIAMKRCCSNGRRLFLHKHSRSKNPSASVLPIDHHLHVYV